jgi:hypothetical protein
MSMAITNVAMRNELGAPSEPALVVTSPGLRLTLSTLGTSGLRLIGCVLLATVLTAACDSDTPASPTPPGSTGPWTLVLAIGQMAVVPGSPLSLKFTAVSNDSRCPVDVTCIQAGEAVVAMEALSRSGDSQFELRTADAARVAQIGNYRVELASLFPVQSVSHPIDPATYQVTLQVNAR